MISSNINWILMLLLNRDMVPMTSEAVHRRMHHPNDNPHIQTPNNSSKWTFKMREMRSMPTNRPWSMVAVVHKLINIRDSKDHLASTRRKIMTEQESMINPYTMTHMTLRDKVTSIRRRGRRKMRSWISWSVTISRRMRSVVRKFRSWRISSPIRSISFMLTDRL